VRIGYVPALEHLGPTEAVHLAAHAEVHGFRGVMAADRFQQRTSAQGQAPYAHPRADTRAVPAASHAGRCC